MHSFIAACTSSPVAPVSLNSFRTYIPPSFLRLHLYTIPNVPLPIYWRISKSIRDECDVMNLGVVGHDKTVNKSFFNHICDNTSTKVNKITDAFLMYDIVTQWVRLQSVQHVFHVLFTSYDLVCCVVQLDCPCHLCLVSKD